MRIGTEKRRLDGNCCESRFEKVTKLIHEGQYGERILTLIILQKNYLLKECIIKIGVVERGAIVQQKCTTPSGLPHP